MKNKIMKKIAAAGMAVFLVGMSSGSGYMWKEVPAYAAETGQREEEHIDVGRSMDQSMRMEKTAVREDKETDSETKKMDAMENTVEEILDVSETVSAVSGDIAEPSDEEEKPNLSEIADMDAITDEIQDSDMDESAFTDNAQSLNGNEEPEENSDKTLPADEDTSPFSDGDSETDTDLQADLTLSVRAENDTVKAGSDLVYTVTVENTGECDLKDIRISYNFSENGLSGEWSESAEDTVGNIAYIEMLEVSATKILYLTVHLPEDRTNAVSLKLSATAGKVSEENDAGEAEEIVKTAELVTQVQALKAVFEVTKTADRSMAVPGDEIRFLICIRNTGERTLHSVVTTERFQLGNVPVRFVEKEGVRLNKAKTKAKIDQIVPGEAFGLEAVVTLPENLKDQNLVNEVSVTTLETGEQTKIAQSEIQVKASEEKEHEETTSDIDGETGSEQEESRPASTHPKTGDPYQPLLWLFMIPGSLLAAGWLRSRM